MDINGESLERLTKIKRQLADGRKQKDESWRQAARFINPNMADWNDEPGNNSKTDDTRNIFDNTVLKASSILTDGIQGYSFARNQAWFKMALEEYNGEERRGGWAQTEDYDGAEAEWMSRAERHLYTQLQKSNFYDEGRSFVKCCADFGTAIMVRSDNLYRSIPSYKTQHLKWCFIDENEYGEVDVLFRDFWINAFQAASQFGKDVLPEAVKQAHDTGSMKLFKFTQAILPPDRYDMPITKKQDKPFYSVFWADLDRKKPLADGWFNLKPFFVWRWSRNLDGDVWGVDAPGMMELPVIKQINSMRRDRVKLSQLAADPPIKASEGLEGKINIKPHGVSYLRSGQDFVPAAVVGSLQGFDQDIAMQQKSINESYYTDFFLILSQNIERQKTATEVAGIQGEKAALMAAFYGRLTSEFLEPVLEDLFALELLAGRMPLPPDSLQGRQLRMDMISPLAQMQKRYLVLGASQQAIAEIAALAQINPAVLDNINFDRRVRNICDAYGLDKREVYDMADVQRMRQTRAQQQQALQKFKMGLEQAKAGADVAGKLPPELMAEAMENGAEGKGF